MTRRDAGCQAVVQSEADVVNTNSVLKVFGGGQLLVDDFDDVQYESRKVGKIKMLSKPADGCCQTAGYLKTNRCYSLGHSLIPKLLFVFALLCAGST